MTSDKERYEQYKARGICVSCKTAKADEGFVTCAECRIKQRNKSRERRAWLKSKKFCPQCGCEKLMGDEKICPECGAKKYISNLKSRKPYSPEYYRKRTEGLKKNGICTQCGKRKAEKGHTMCRTCLEKKKHRKGFSRHEYPDYGMCYICGSSITEGSLCKECKDRVTSNLPKTTPNPYWRQQNEILFRKGSKNGVRAV